MTEKCFKKCISKPGTSLDSSEQVGDYYFFKTDLFLFVCRNVLRCVWIDIWIPGI